MVVHDKRIDVNPEQGLDDRSFRVYDGPNQIDNVCERFEELLKDAKEKQTGDSNISDSPEA